MQICLLVLMLFASHAFGQKQTNVEVERVIRAAFFNPGFSYEDRIGRLQTIHFDAYFSTSAYYSYSSSLGADANVYFDPALMLQYRYYYNAPARESKGKRTEMNSLNYFGPQFDMTFTKAALKQNSFEEESRRPVYTFGFVWGIQRNYKKRLSLDLNLGLGYFFAKGTELGPADEKVSVNQSNFTTVGNVSLGFWLNKR